MRNQWCGCFVFVFYSIADGPSVTVYTKRALVETKTFSCTTPARTSTASHPRVKTLSHQVGPGRSDEIRSDCAASVSGCGTNPNSARNQQFIYGHIDHGHRSLLVCCATFRLRLQRIKRTYTERIQSDVQPYNA